MPMRTITIRLLGVLTAMMFAVPSSALPCPCEPQPADQNSPVAEQLAQSAGCCSCAAPNGEPSDAPEPTRDGGHGPCDCPVCPASCGAGKPQCPPIELASAITELPPAGDFLPLHDVPPADAPSQGVFHPPRA